MSRRIDIELTSALADGTFTWRAAGARQPKGVVDRSVLPAGAKVGDELKVEVEQEIDGITILSVVQGRAKVERSLLELLPAEREFQPVVETRAPGGRGPRRDGDRRPRRDRDGDGGERRPRQGGERREGGEARERRPRRDGDGGGGGRGGDRAGDRGRRGPSFTPPPELPQRPKPHRLKPGKTHRTAVLADLPEEQRPIAELALQGIGAVRTRVREENQKLEAEGKPAMPEQSVVKLAEELLPKLRVAEWRDRAEAAQRQLANLDLRDLRSVVASAGDPIVARDESTRTLAHELTEALATKQEQELQLWFGDVDAALAVGRVIRALRLSSQPPKAGVPFPGSISQRLVDSTNASLAPMDPPDRWAALLEAAAFSPIRLQIKPVRKPDVVSDELLATVTRLAPALPQVAELFGVEVDPKAQMPKPLRPTRPDGKGGDKPGGRPERAAKSDKPARPPKPAAEAPAEVAATDQAIEPEVGGFDTPSEAAAQPPAINATEPGAAAEAEPITDTEPVTDAHAASTEPETEPVVEADRMAEPETVAEIESVVGAQAEPDGPAAEIEAESTAPEPVAEAQPVVDIEPEPAPEIEAVTEPEPAAEPASVVE